MSGETIETKLCDSLNIKVGGINFFHVSVGVFGIMSLLPKELIQIDGLISLKTFEQMKIILNLSENEQIIETDESFDVKVKSMDLVESPFANGTNGTKLNIFIGNPFNHYLWWVLFDSGNISQTKISTNVAEEWGLKTDTEGGITALGEFKFAVANDSIVAPTIIDKIIYDGALSFNFICQSEYAISFKDQKVWTQKHITTKNKHH